MTNQPTIAAVVTNYNYDAYIGEAITALLDQTEPFDEIVVVDDGSSDQSLARLEKFAARGVRVIAQANAGQMAACRTGMHATTSDYVYFLDADDVPLPELTAEVRRRADRQVSKVQFMLEGIDDAGDPLGSVFPALEADYGSELMRRDNAVIGFYRCPPTSGNVFARWALDRLPLDSVNPRESIDGEVALAMPYLGEVVSLPMTLGRYRVHGRNKSLSQADTGVAGLGQGNVAVLDRLDFETSRLETRWTWLSQALGEQVDARRLSPGLFVAERELMKAALRNEPRRYRRFVDFAGPLLKSSLPRRHRAVYLAWALACVVPVRPVSRNAVMWRRQASSRPAWLRTLMSRVSRS